MYLKFYECCEHEDKCVGIPPEVYAPWLCLEADPFYSCDLVLEECVKDQTADDNCIANFNDVIELCPTEMFSTQVTCPAYIPDDCIERLRSLGLG